MSENEAVNLKQLTNFPSAPMSKLVYSHNLVELVQAHILTIDEARAVLGYEARPGVFISGWTSGTRTITVENGNSTGYINLDPPQEPR